MTSEPLALDQDEPLFSLDSPAKTSPSQDVAAAYVRAHAPASSSRSSASFATSLPAGSFSRTSLDSCRRTEDGLWAPSSGAWLTSGMGSPTECWTLSTSESPSDAVESSLSDVLETPGQHLLRYCLSPKAAAGILRRAERRGKVLPAALHEALAALASSAP